VEAAQLVPRPKYGCVEPSRDVRVGSWSWENAGALQRSRMAC